jgi:hypothetical protein
MYRPGSEGSVAEANQTVLCGNHKEPALRHAGGGGQEYGLNTDGLID